MTSIFSYITPATLNGYEHAVKFGSDYVPSYDGHSYSTLSGKVVPHKDAERLGDAADVPQWAAGLRKTDTGYTFLNSDDIERIMTTESVEERKKNPIYFRGAI